GGANAAASAPVGSEGSGRWSDAITSMRSAAAARPSALRTPGCGGSTIVRIPSASASAPPKSGPAPPYGKSASRRGSNPRATLTRLSARAIVAAATATIPAAMARGSRPTADPSDATARSAADGARRNPYADGLAASGQPEPVQEDGSAGRD